jgi:hypothetical protein
MARRDNHAMPKILTAVLKLRHTPHQIVVSAYNIMAQSSHHAKNPYSSTKIVLA